MLTDTQYDALVSAYLSNTLSATAFAEAFGWETTGPVMDLLATMHSEYHASPCNAEGATPEQLVTLDRIIARAVARIEGILAR